MVLVLSVTVFGPEFEQADNIVEHVPVGFYVIHVVIGLMSISLVGRGRIEREGSRRTAKPWAIFY
tara:strand:+ start:168186 stop:168380 length:195 start_codon:yes stop_codon:yes gene_type:complete